MAAQALRESNGIEQVEQVEHERQLGLGLKEACRPPRRMPFRPAVKVCAGCRAKEARYGFVEDPGQERPRSLCFDCFRMELDRRRRAAAQLARGWNAEQARLPLARDEQHSRLEELSLRRRRAQIAARRALGI